MKANNQKDSHPSDALLLLALDSEIGPGEAAAISLHVEDCPVCRVQWEQWRRISEGIVGYHLRELQVQVPPVSTTLWPVGRPSRRNRAKSRVVAAFSGAAAALVCLVWLFTRPDRPLPVTHRLAGPAPAAVASPPTSPQPQAVRHLPPRLRRDIAVAADDHAFWALPFSDDALPLSDATVVRVQLPVDELRLTGLTVEGDHTGVTIQADVLLGMDGLPRGIRLVQ